MVYWLTSRIIAKINNYIYRTAVLSIHIGSIMMVLIIHFYLNYTYELS